MCGLAGFVGTGTQANLAAMAGAIVHRGPDDTGFHIDHDHAVHLAFLRLAIVDIAGGRQPMWNEDGSVCVLFNGEIYNQAELRAELLAAGHVFRSDHSDTEVLVHGYEQWGEDLPARLNGMFAFVIWDRPRRRLFAARDRFGEKPFFYVARPGFFAFASELSALIMHPAVDRTIDQRALQKFFAYGYIPAPNALYRGARKLPGGCSLTLDLADFRVRERRYWRFAIEADEHAPEERIAELTEELRALLDRAVTRRLVSDVPLGVFLSGGIDSSMVLALAAQHRAAAEPRHVHHRLQRAILRRKRLRTRRSPPRSVRATTNGSWISTPRAVSLAMYWRDWTNRRETPRSCRRTCCAPSLANTSGGGGVGCVARAVDGAPDFACGGGARHRTCGVIGVLCLVRVRDGVLRWGRGVRRVGGAEGKGAARWSFRTFLEVGEGGAVMGRGRGGFLEEGGGGLLQGEVVGACANSAARGRGLVPGVLGGRRRASAFSLVVVPARRRLGVLAW